MQNFIHTLSLPPLLCIGIVSLLSLFSGKLATKGKLPSLIGFMLVGVAAGPSLLDLLNEEFQLDLGFITEVALGFVALSIGLELKFSELKKQGAAIILIIFTESFAAFAFVTGLVYLVTRDLPLSLIFGAIAPASAPAGTVAIIHEYKAKGPLTRALYSVVGFDDGLGIIIFGFAFAAAKAIISAAEGIADISTMEMILTPLKEAGLSVVTGAAMAALYVPLSRLMKTGRDLLLLSFSIVLITVGLCTVLNLSLILTNMILGMAFTNTQPSRTVKEIDGQLRTIMPLLFLLFFTLAGANLHLAALPSLGIVGLVYIIGRTAGLMGGAWFGAVLGRAESNIRRYLGMGILSQAGVAIGLSLIVKHELSGLGAWGSQIGGTVITTVTATCIFFEIVGPVLTRIGLTRAGEIK